MLNIRTIRHLAIRVSIKERDLRRIANTADQKYYRKELTQPNGKVRVLEPPRDDLMTFQSKLAKWLNDTYGLPSYFMGGVPGRCALSNANEHLGEPLVQPLDLKDFFPSVTCKMVYNAFVKAGCTSHVARMLTRLTTVNGHIPQGSPTSCVVAAIVLRPTTDRLKNLADQMGWNFSVYVDDLTISGPPWIERFKNMMIRILAEDGFRPHAAESPKSRGVHRRQEQVVTGFRVNGQRAGVTDEQRAKLFRKFKTMKAQAEKTGHFPAKRDVQSLLGTVYTVRRVNAPLANSILHDHVVKRWRKVHRC